MTKTDEKAALVVGASRALGLELATELLRRGWRVIATTRGGGLPDLAAQFGDRLTVEHLDMTERDEITALHDRLGTTSLNLLFVNAGMTNKDEPVEDVPTEDFVNVMVTNALSPMRVVDQLRDLVAPDGTIAVMSSRQGSISMNERGGHEVYRASKSALNQLMRSYFARNQDDARTLLLMHPGWVQTDLGGPGAQLTVGESVHGLVDVLEQHAHDGGLQFLDYRGAVVAW